MAEFTAAAFNPAATKLRAVLARPEMILLPGVHDGFSARAAEIIGFDAIYVGGMVAVAANLGVPDMGIITVDSLIEHAGRIAAVVDIPVVADLDDGGGSPIRVRRAVQMAERVGLAGLQLEDNDYSHGKHFPAKQHGQAGMATMDFTRDRPIPLEDAVDRVHAAVEARRNPATLIIARTDACLFSFDEAIERANRYVEAGADMIYLGHLKTHDVGRAARAIQAPLMNMSNDRAEGSNGDELAMMRDAGVKMHFYAAGAAFAAYDAAWDVLEAIKRTGTVDRSYDRVMGRLSQVVRHQDWGALAERYRMI